jgi:adenylate kinase
MDHPTPRPHRDHAVVLFGKPGSGKGTQGLLLSIAPNLVHVDMGDLLRERRDRPGVGPRLAAGEMVPDAVVMDVFDAHLDDLVRRGLYQPGRDLLILDGIPRSRGQAEALAQRLEVVQVVVLRCDDDAELVRRLQQRAEEEGRADDTDPAVIEKRISDHEADVAPVIGWYPSELVAEVDGLRSPIAVRDDIVRHLRPAMLALSAAGLGAPR